MLRFLSSVRLAVILIAVIAGLSVSATLYDLPDLFRSLPFRAVVALFFVNLLTCSVKLWPGLLRTLRQNAAGVASERKHFRPADIDEAVLRKVLAAGRFRLDTRALDGGTVLYAKRGILPLLAPHILHIGILVIIVGAVLSSFSVKDSLQLAPGETASLPPSIVEKTGEMTIRVNEFRTVYDDYGAVENWITRFHLSGAGHDEDAETRVNKPYKSGGLSIYQMAYANRYEVRLEGGGDDFDGVYEFPEDQRMPLSKGSMMFSAMSENTVLFTLFDEEGRMERQEGLRPGEGVNLGDGLKAVYQKPLSFTVLELKVDHAVPVVFAGFILAALASFCFWLGRFCAVAAYVAADGAISVRVYSKSARVRQEMEDALKVCNEKKDKEHD